MKDENDQTITEKHREEINAMLDRATEEQIERLYYFMTRFIR